MNSKAHHVVSAVLALILVISVTPISVAQSRTASEPNQDVFTVTFNPGSGASVDIESITVINGMSYGDLPTPVKNAYAFDGWFTSAVGGTWITKSTVVDLTEDQTLYAHWTSVGFPYTVTFNANDGNVEPKSKEVYAGAPYGDLPTPTYRSYGFEGWYTERVGGKLVTRTTIVTRREHHTLYAHWSNSPVVPGFCKVTLNPSGGSVSPDSITAKYDEPFGDLPIPERKGYTFLGWFTSKSGGDRVTSVTTVPHMTTYTLYAQWTKEEPSKVTISDLSYQFANSREGFQYGEDYKIDYSQYALIFGDREAARWYYENDIGWGGNCYGMSVTAGMFYRKDNGANPDSFRTGAKSPSDIALNDRNQLGDWNGITLKGFIEAMQVSQKSSVIQNELNKNKDRYDDLCAAVTAFQSSGNNPVVIAIARKKNGHAILGYKLVEVSSTESHLMVYDSNFPNVERYITLTKSQSGQYVGWYYNMNNQDSWGSNYEGSWISYISYSSACMPWINKGITRTDMERELLSINTDSAAILNSANESVATVLDGELHTSRSDIFPMLEMADTKAEASRRFSVWLPVGEYTITNNDESVKEIDAAMVHWDQSSKIKTAASSVTYLVNDVKSANCILIDEPGKKYEITFSSSLTGSNSQITLTGVTGTDISHDNKMAFAQIGGVLYADHVNLGGANKLVVNGKEEAASEIKGSAIDKISSIMSPATASFVDVPSTAYYFNTVAWAVGRGITKGYSQTHFGPNDNCTRAQVLTFLWRAEGSPVVSVANPFSDVPAGSFYENAARWAYSKGMVEGLIFGGNNSCSRAEAVTYLWKLIGSPEAEPCSFNDVSASADYATAVAWAFHRGITNGTSETTFSPQRTCTRGQIVTFLYNHYMK